MIRIMAAICVLMLSVSHAFAHSTSRSFSIWQANSDQVRATFTIDRVQASVLGLGQSQDTALETLLTAHLATHIHVTQGGTVCAPSPPEALTTTGETLRIALLFTCAKPAADNQWRVQNDAFYDLVAGHIHIAQNQNAPQGLQFIFTDAKREHSIGMGANTSEPDTENHSGFWANFATYIHLGITHILEGFDHLAFITALILLARHYKDVAILITGFTLGHSVTLSLAALGFIHPNGAAIEALIGFSIAFIAMEIMLKPGSRDWRVASAATALLFLGLAGVAMFGQSVIGPLSWVGLAAFVFCYSKLVTSFVASVRASLAITTAFGLIHGAGFASVLSEAGLPDTQKIAALTGFNIGVELGQIAVVVAWLIAFAALRRFAGANNSPNITENLQKVLSGGVMVLGVYWFFSRALILAS